MEKLLATRITGGNTAYKRAESDFYPTPEDVTLALLDFMRIPRGVKIWEPADGAGDMVQAIKSRGYEVIGTDIQTGTDFLETELPEGVGMIITNPPFSASEAFIQHALELGVPFAFLLKSQYWHAARRYSIFEKTPPSYVLPLTWRPDFLFKQRGKGSPLMDVMWCAWMLPFGGGTTFRPLKRPEACKVEQPGHRGNEDPEG